MIHATGCYTTAPIAEGTFIVEYTGPRLTGEEAEAQYADQEETYLFGLDDGKHVIDGFGEAGYLKLEGHTPSISRSRKMVKPGRRLSSIGRSRCP